MKYMTLQSTDLKVSGICLGTVKYGTDMEERDAWEQLERFLELGGNFLDTAHVYGDWTPGERAKSERTIGRWIGRTGRRREIVISTKGAHPPIEDMGISRVRPECIRQDLDESLEALQTDYIDLYFLHRDDASVPVEELLGTLEEARRQGKVRWYGCSNWTLPRILEADAAAKKEGFSGFICNQLMWSLADINVSAMADPTMVAMDQATYGYHRETGKSAMAYSAAAQGYLAKRARGESVSGRLQELYGNDRNERILEILEKYGMPVSQASFAYLTHHGFTAVPIVTFRTREQLEEGARSADLELPEGLMEEIRRARQ